MSFSPDPQFIQAIKANIAYWRQCLDAWSGQASLTFEYPNLVRALEYGLGLPETQLAAAQLARHGHSLIERRGYWQSWLPLLDRAVMACAESSLLLHCQLLICRGRLFRLTQQLTAALADHKKAESTARQLSADVALVEAQFNLSEDYRLTRQYEQAETYGQMALKTLERFDRADQWQASVRNTLGLTAWEQGDLVTAERHLITAVNLWRTLYDPTQLARSLNNLANTWLSQEKFETALATYQEAADVLDTTDSELDKSRVQLSLGSLHFRLEAYQQAELAFRRADSMALQQSGDNALQGIQAQNLGNALLKQKRYAEAEIHLRKGVGLWQSINDGLMLANTTGTLAEALAAQGQVEAALTLYSDALVLLEEEDNAMARRLHKGFTISQQKWVTRMAEKGHVNPMTNAPL